MHLCYAQKLGNLVRLLWREKNCDVRAFPDAASAALRELPADQHISTNDITEWVLRTDQIPLQMDLEERFGQPPITLFSDGRIQIDAYFWLDGSTDIHEHGFAGAFFVLQGASVHCQYKFQPERIYNERLKTGKLTVARVEVLKRGDCRRIAPGSECIHSLFHLDRPSVTIVVRVDALWAMPQLAYKWPGLAHASPRYDFPIERRRRQILAMLRNVQHPRFIELLTQTLLTSEPYGVYSLLAANRDYFSGKPEQLRELLKNLTRQHGELIAVLCDVFRHLSRTESIHQLRYHVRSAELRFFLALLLNLHCRQDILNLTERQFPKRDPVETILEWTQQLAGINPFGDSSVNPLGIELHSRILCALRSSLEGRLTNDPWASHIHVTAHGGKLSVHSEALRARDRSILSPLFQG